LSRHEQGRWRRSGGWLLTEGKRSRYPRECPLWVMGWFVPSFAGNGRDR
jgi:hypothetical protein